MTEKAKFNARRPFDRQRSSSKDTIASGDSSRSPNERALRREWPWDGKREVTGLDAARRSSVDTLAARTQTFPAGAFGEPSASAARQLRSSIRRAALLGVAREAQSGSAKNSAVSASWTNLSANITAPFRGPSDCLLVPWLIDTISRVSSPDGSPYLGLSINRSLASTSPASWRRPKPDAAPHSVRHLRAAQRLPSTAITSRASRAAKPPNYRATPRSEEKLRKVCAVRSREQKRALQRPVSLSTLPSHSLHYNLTSITSSTSSNG